MTLIDCYFRCPFFFLSSSYFELLERLTIKKSVRSILNKENISVLGITLPNTDINFDTTEKLNQFLDLAQKNIFNLINYQIPVFSMLAQGSMGSKGSFFWSSSMEILSGDFINAILPSFGGRLMTMPCSNSLLQTS